MMNTMMRKLMVTVASAVVAITAMTATAATVAYANDGVGIETMDVTTSECQAEKYVAASAANVRTAPSTESRILKAFDYGTKVYVDGYTSNGWYRVWTTDPVYGGQCFGYVAGNLLADSLQNQAVSNTSSALAANDQTWITFTNSSNTSREKAARGQMSHDNDTFTASVKSGYLALRSSAYSCNDNIIGEVQNGMMVQVQQYGSQFDYVYVPALDMYGFVNNDYLA